MSKQRAWLTNWVPHRLELMISPPWSLAPRTLRVMLERLEIEHLRHGGFKNGELFVSYGQFVLAGISRKSIRRTQQLGVDLGLMDVIYSETSGDIRPPNAYRLTYLPAKGKNAPSDEWKAVGVERATALIKAYQTGERQAGNARRRAVA